jgi:xanthine dehydrogenase large subunit
MDFKRNQNLDPLLLSRARAMRHEQAPAEDKLWRCLRDRQLGGFIQGMGWCTTEELKYAPGGELLSHSPTTYKIPNISDLPAVFNVRMLDNPNSTMSLKRSKATGEPPLLLGLSVWAAVKNALGYLTPGHAIELQLPATNEQILMRMHDLKIRNAPHPGPLPKGEGGLVPSPSGRGLG